jgi:hypothetical protein
MRDGHSLFGQEAVMGCALETGRSAMRAPYITARTALLPLLTRRCVSRGSDVWKQSQGVGVVVTGVGSWELRYQVPDFVTIFVSPSKPLCSGYSGFVYRARLSGWLVG